MTSRRSKFAVQALLFLRFAAIDGNALALLVDVHQGEAEIGLARVALGVERTSDRPDAPADSEAAPA